MCCGRTAAALRRLERNDAKTTPRGAARRSARAVGGVRTPQPAVYARASRAARENMLGADEVDKQLLSLIASSERKSFIDNLAILAAEMDRIEEKEPPKPARKIKSRKRA